MVGRIESARNGFSALRFCLVAENVNDAVSIDYSVISKVEQATSFFFFFGVCLCENSTISVVG